MSLKERRQREKEERRRQILDAARQLLFEKGLNATSINQIAKLAELGVGTIYFYFQSKEEIFAGLQEEGLGILYEDIDAVCSKGMDAPDTLGHIARIYLRFSREHKDYFDIINYFLASPDVIFAPNLKNQIDRHGNRILSLIVDTVEQGIAKRQLTPVDARKWAFMFWGTLHGLIQFKKLEQTVLQGDSHESVFEYSVENLINGIRKG